MQLVKQVRGITIALAPTNSPVAETADISIKVDSQEDNQIYIPLTSRIAHLAVIDVLAIGVAQKKGAKLDEHLKRLKAGLISLRTQETEEKHYISVAEKYKNA